MIKKFSRNYFRITKKGNNKREYYNLFLTQFSFHNLILIIVNNCNSYLLLSTVNREVGCENISDDKKKKVTEERK